jgi:hypothetical protein
VLIGYVCLMSGIRVIVRDPTGGGGSIASGEANGNTELELIESATGWLLNTDGDRPPVVYSPETNQSYALQDDGSYQPTGPHKQL